MEISETCKKALRGVDILLLNRDLVREYEALKVYVNLLLQA